MLGPVGQGRGMGVEIGCTECGRIVVDAGMLEVHANRRDDFALFVGVCPHCGELVVGSDRGVIGQALAEGARRFELYPTDVPPLTIDDLVDLHAWLETPLAQPPA